MLNNHRLKKYFAVFIILSCLVIATCCFASEDKVRIVTTTADLKSIAESVGGDKVTVTSIANGYEDPPFC